MSQVDNHRDECLFQFEPVFVTNEGQVITEAITPAVSLPAIDDSALPSSVPDPTLAFNAAQKYLEARISLWDWSDDVEFLGLSWVEFR